VVQINKNENRYFLPQDPKKGMVSKQLKAKVLIIPIGETDQRSKLI